MALIGVLSTACFAGVARAYQIAAPSIVAAFSSRQPYGDCCSSPRNPDLLTIDGMILITIAGLLVAARSFRKATVEKIAAA